MVLLLFSSCDFFLILVRFYTLYLYAVNAVSSSSITALIPDI